MVRFLYHSIIYHPWKCKNIPLRWYCQVFLCIQLWQAFQRSLSLKTVLQFYETVVLHFLKTVELQFFIFVYTPVYCLYFHLLWQRINTTNMVYVAVSHIPILAWYIFLWAILWAISSRIAQDAPEYQRYRHSHILSRICSTTKTVCFAWWYHRVPPVILAVQFSPPEHQNVIPQRWYI